MIGLDEGLLSDVEHKLHELGAVELEDLLVLADSLEQLEELELGLTGAALTLLWERVAEANERAEVWLQQQAADKTRQQQEEEEARVSPSPSLRSRGAPDWAAPANSFRSHTILTCLSAPFVCVLGVRAAETAADTASAGGREAAGDRWSR